MRGGQPWRTSRARALRANETSAEAKLWAELEGRRHGGLKFVRQAPIGSFYVNFICRERRIAVEIDGGTHSSDAALANDVARDEALSQIGYRVLRISNADVYDNLDDTLGALLAFAQE